MKEYIMEKLLDLPYGGGFVILGLLVLVIAKIAKDFLTPYKVDEQLTEKDNPALGLSMTGYYLGVIIIFIGVLYDDLAGGVEYTPQAFGADMIEVFCYSLGGILLLNISRVVVDKCVLTNFSTHKEIITDKNVGTGAVEFGNYIASGLIIAGALNGEGLGEWWNEALIALVFFALGEVGLIIFSRIYQVFTKYDIHHEIEQDNVAAGVALGGNMAAIGIVLLKGLKGDFTGWTENLCAFGIYAIAGFILLLLVRWIADLFMLPNATFDEEIAKDRNIAAAWIESAVSIGSASIIFFAL